MKTKLSDYLLHLNFNKNIKDIFHELFYLLTEEFGQDETSWPSCFKNLKEELDVLSGLLEEQDEKVSDSEKMHLINLKNECLIYLKIQNYPQ